MMGIAKPNRVIALGFFDSVHLGHGALLERTSQLAKKTGATPCALTFDVHPEALITKMPIPLINTVGDRASLIRRLYGIEEVIFTHFDEVLMETPWQDFVRNMLIGSLNASHLVAGYDFHFGHKGKGNPTLLGRECGRLGCGCDIIPRVKLEGITVSSTYIRKLVAQGDVERAARFLGHPHCLSGMVGHGRRLATKLGVPTVNFPFPDGLQCPANGVYISTAHLGPREMPAITNIGRRPTVATSQSINVETHILDFDQDIYGAPIRLDLLRFLRPERRFPSLGTMRARIQSDLAEARAFFAQSTVRTAAP